MSLAKRRGSAIEEVVGPIVGHAMPIDVAIFENHHILLDCFHTTKVISLRLVADVVED